MIRKYLLLTFLIFCSCLSWAGQSQYGRIPIKPDGLTAGSYLGKDQQNAWVHLLLRDMPQTQGSFFALLVRQTPNYKMSLYRVDKLLLGTFVMTPLIVTDGEIGILNDNPSLVLTISKDDWGNHIFKLKSSKSGNTVGFQGPLIFNGEVSRSEWVDVDEGNYHQNIQRKYTLDISNFDHQEKQATVDITNNESQSGNYLMEEIVTGMYLLKQNAFLNTGMHTQKNPSSIGVFFKDGYNRYNRSSFILINPRNDEDITVFDK